MVCANIETNKRYDYRFIDEMSVEIKDFESNTEIIPYYKWCKEYYVIDKWRNLNKDDMCYGKDRSKICQEQ